MIIRISKSKVRKCTKRLNHFYRIHNSGDLTKNSFQKTSLPTLLEGDFLTFRRVRYIFMMTYKIPWNYILK